MADRQLPPPEDDEPFLAEGDEPGLAAEGASARRWRRLAAGGLAATLLSAAVLAAACTAAPARRSAPSEGRRDVLRLFEDIFDDPRPVRDIFNDPRQLNDPVVDDAASTEAPEGVRDIDPSKIFQFSSRNSDGGDGKPAGDAADVVPKAADAAAAPTGTADDVSALGSGAVDVETPEAAKEFNLSAPDPESCAAYGCEGYDPTRSCQCDPTCGEHRSCCYDYNMFCKTTTTRITTTRFRGRAPPVPDQGSSGGGHDNYFSDGGDFHGAAGHAPQEHHHHEHHSHEGSCAEMGCLAEFQSGKPCQCNPDCDKFDSCCHDYDDVCTSDGSEGNHHSHHHDDDHDHEEHPARAHGPATCANYGCGGDFVTSQECQCNSDCEKYDSCCPDYSRHCDKRDGHGHHHEDKSSSHSHSSAGHGPATCKNYGCGGEFAKSQGCQCNADCEEYDSCCPDYARQCGDVRHKHHSGSGKSANHKKHDGGYAGNRTLGQHEKKKAELGSGPPDGVNDPDNNCKNYGCQDDFIPEFRCQCAPSCKEYHSCCWDYKDVCPGS